VTPKCLWFSTNFTFSLLKTIQGLLAAWLVENIIHSVFFGLKSIVFHVNEPKKTFLVSVNVSVDNLKTYISSFLFCSI
jgi:hypothetical protein